MTSSIRRHPVPLAIALLLAAGATACRTQRVPPAAPSRAAMSAPVAGEATVFTDPALYRRVCAEADSGLTAASRRCTPRDQSALAALPKQP